MYMLAINFNLIQYVCIAITTVIMLKIWLIIAVSVAIFSIKIFTTGHIYFM